MQKKENKINMSVLLFTDNNELKESLDYFRQNTKMYNKVIEALLKLGKFTPYIKLELYEHYFDENEVEITKSALFDVEGNMYIITLKSASKHDSYLIQKVSDEEEKKYNTLIAKNYELNNNNIELCRVDEQYKFKLGRLNTNKTSYINILLGDGVSYRIEGSFNSENINIEQILNDLNSVETKLNLLIIIKVLEKYVLETPGDFSVKKITEYINFEPKRAIELKEDKAEIQGKSLTRRKNKD